jgi:hypothetical protein
VVINVIEGDMRKARNYDEEDAFDAFKDDIIST